LGLAFVALATAPSAAGAAPLDTVTATGSASSLYSNIQITAQSGSSGENPSGNVSLTIGNVIDISGPVTSLTVTGSDSGAGTSTASTVALIGVQTTQHGPQTVKLVDSGGNGLDTICVWSGAPPDCTMILGGEPFNVSSPLSNGRAVVFDAPLLPTSKGQCLHGGWRNYGNAFKNQGQCVAFVEKQARQRL
jgi:hypothetical protein